MMPPLPPAGRRVVGRALAASAALLWLRAVPIAEEMIGVVEGLVGLRFLGES